MASSHSSASLPVRASLAFSRTAPLPGSLKSTASYDRVLASWSKAIDLFNSKLTKDESKRINLTQFPRAQFEDFLAAANAVKEQVERKRYPWTEHLHNVLRHINRYAVVGDIIVQHHAEYTSLVWGAFRFLLLFAVEERSSSEELSKALETIIQIVFRAEEYAKLFSTPSGSSTDRVFQSLHENLVRLFAEILSFLIRTTRFFEKPTLSKINNWNNVRRFVSAGISPFNTKFRGILKRIEDFERDVEKDKASKTQQEYQNGVWLKHADFEADLQKLQQVHISGTCQWFVHSQAYLQWRDTSSTSIAPDFMWIQGKPGSGKSVLASQIIQDLHSFGGSIVTYIFCKNGQENKNTLESILRNLIFEILEFSPQKQAFHRLLLNARLNEKSQYVQSMEVLWNLLTRIIIEVDIIHCLVDGLDECHSPESERIAFLNRLVKIFRQRTPHAKLVFLSQLQPSESEDSSFSSLWTNISIQPASVQDDIKLLALTRIENSKVLNLHPEKDGLLKQLVARSNGMPLWTDLMIEELEAGHWNIHNVLQRPPEGLFDLWRSILERISHSRRITERISHVLQLVLAAARPLSYEELALGLAVAQGLSQHEDYDRRGDATAEGRLIVNESSPLLNSLPDNTVELAHSSLKDYLFSQDALSVSKFFDFNEQDVHAQMSTILIKYMSFQSFSDAFTEQIQPGCFLLEYATRWLVYHSTRTGASTQTANELVIFFDTHQGWKWLQRLSDKYNVSFGHLQVLQSDLASWAQLSCFIDKIVSTFGSLLLVLAQNRHETMKSLPNDSPLLLDSMTNLARTLRYQGNWKEAEELQVQLMKIHKRILGKEHPDTLMSMHNLALGFDKQGRYKESEKLNELILEKSTKVLGEEHPSTLTTMSNLALTFENQGRYKESEKLNERILEARTKVLGAEHPETLKTMHNLASSFDSQGRYKESEELNERILEAKTRVLGAEHPETLTTMSNLASSFDSQGRYEQSEKLNEQILETRTRVLGAEHPDTLTTMHNLALSFGSQGRYKESEKLNEQILETKTRVLGAEHPETLRTMSNLALTFENQGRYEESEKLNMQILATRTRVLGAEHPETLKTMHNLASSFDRQGRYKESEKLDEQILETETRVLGAEHPDTLTTMHNLASSFHRQGRYKESEKLNEQILETRTRVLGEEHPNTLITMSNLASSFDSQGRCEESEKLNGKILETMTRVLGEEHPSTLTTMHNLAVTIFLQDRLKEAEQLLVKVTDTSTRVLGAEHPHTLTAMSCLAQNYHALDDRNKAIELMEKVVDLRSKKIGPNHPHTLNSVSLLNKYTST
ncbi:hypothetical protein MMC22_002313 [Lobaria immixta]|nr:hypothetical protein [Lobaria immixta]